MIYRQFNTTTMRFLRICKNRCVASVIAASLLCCSTGCKEEFESSSPSTLSQTEVFDATPLALQALNGVYVRLSSGNLYGKKLSYYLSLNSDTECISGDTDNGRRAIARYVATPYNTELKSVWESIYIAIREANNFIEGVNGSKLLSSSNDDRTTILGYKGEALTIRALLYFELVRSWGDVPFILDANSDYTSKTNRKEILDHILNDITEAIEWLPATSTTPSRISKDAARSLGARIALYRAGFHMTDDHKSAPSDRNDYIEKAKDWCKEVIDGGHYSLESDYEQIFRKIMSYKNSDEIIFEIAMSKGNSGELGYFVGKKHADGSPYGSSECGVLVPTSHYHKYNHFDVRRDVSLSVTQYDGSGKEKVVSPNNISIGKFRREWLNPVITGKQKYSGVDLPVIRYADVLLMYAESVTELEHTATSEAKEALKEVRKRAFAGAPDSVLTVALDKYIANIRSYEEMTNVIRDERAFEFTAEMIRKFDLKRWGVLQQTLDSCKSDLRKILVSEAPFNDIPDKLVWYVDDDNEHVKIATTDNYRFDPTFDFTRTVKTTKWKTAITEDFINRMCEAMDDTPYDLPIPEE